MVNHIDGHSEITRKDKLLENFTYYCEVFFFYNELIKK